MKIGLIPQVLINGVTPLQSSPYVPLGLLCVAASVNRNKYKFEIVDLVDLVVNQKIGFGRNFEKDAAYLLKSKKFDLIGFSTLSAGYHYTLKIISELKKISRTPVVLGGAQASFCDMETIKAFPFDIIVRGEGERTFAELIEAMAGDKDFSAIKGLTYRNGKDVVKNQNRPFIENIDDLPYPAYDLYPLSTEKYVPIEATRGCPYTCAYCTTSIHWGKCTRAKSTKRVLDELMLLRDKFGVKKVSFVDDTFTLNRKRTEEFCSRMIEKKMGLKWACSTRIDKVDDPLLKIMSDAGCAGIFYGIETGSPKMQKLIKKNIKLETVHKNIESTAKYGINVTASFIIGFPDEDEKELSKTLNLANKVKCLYPTPQTVQLHVLAPDSNTPITVGHYGDLQYDGFFSDQVGGGFAGYDVDLIKKNKDLFIAYHYIKTKKLDRQFIRALYSFFFAVALIAYWSTLSVFLKDKNPLILFKKWREFHADFKMPPGITAKLNEQLVATTSVSQFLNRYFKEERSIPKQILELFVHENEAVNLKGLIVTNAGTRKKAMAGEILSTKFYRYHPKDVIEAIRKSVTSVTKVKESPVKVEYYLSGKELTPPIIGYNISEHTFGRR